MKVAIFGSRHQDQHLPRLQQFLTALDAAQPRLTLSIEERLYNYIVTKISVPESLHVFNKLDEAPDLALSIGGDGTFLRVAKIIGRYQTPIMGINTGHLGYLSAATIDECDTIVADILSNNYQIEPRSVLKIQADSPELRGNRYALNELAILRRDTASMINVCASFCNQPLAEYRGDGLIVSTPTGSTGYNLSVGGPILAPDAPCWVVAPIAPHALNMRPLVLSDRNACITLTCQARSETFMLSLDGKATVMPIDAKLTVTRAPWHVNLVHRNRQNFVDTIRNKLGWSS